jgi:hypothetical protein
VEAISDKITRFDDGVPCHSERHTSVVTVSHGAERFMQVGDCRCMLTDRSCLCHEVCMRIQPETQSLGVFRQQRSGPEGRFQTVKKTWSEENKHLQI